MPELTLPVAGNESPNFAWGEVVAAADPLESHVLWSALEADQRAQTNARLLAEWVLQPMRDRLGGPIRVTSWYRTPEHNSAVDGAPHSLHLIGAGADLVPVDRPLADLQAVAETLRERCQEIIVYPGDGHIHVGMAASFNVGKVLVKRQGGAYATVMPAATVALLGIVLVVGALLLR